MKKIIDVMIDSGSRPEILKETLPTIIDNLVFSGKLRWMFHEAIINKEKSEENIEWIKSLNMFDVIEVNEPVGQAISIGNILEHCKSKYLFHIEDDYIIKRNIDLDVMWDIIENANDVNQLIFHRRKTMPKVSGWEKGMYVKANHVLTTSPHWRFTPALWRLSFIKPKWIRWEGDNGHWALNKMLQEGINPVTKTHEWVANNMGTFYYGPINELAYCEHVGSGFSGRLPKKVAQQDIGLEKLHICCGSVYLDGYCNVDIQGKKRKPDEVVKNKSTLKNYYNNPLNKVPKEDRGKFVVDEKWNILSLWPVKSESVKSIIMIQSIEHFLPSEAEYIVNEVYRVLIPGGEFKFDFPNIVKTVHDYSEVDFDFMTRLIYCNHKDKYSIHKCCYNEEKFTNLLEFNNRKWSKIEFKDIIEHEYPVIGGIATKW